MAVSFRDHLRALHRPASPVITTRKLLNASLAFGEVVGGPGLGMADPLPYDEAYLVSVRLIEGHHARVFYDGREEKRYDLRRGSMRIHDLRRRPQVEVWDAFHMLNAYLPRVFLTAFAEQMGKTFHDFPADHRASAIDPVVESLMRSLQPAMARPQEVNTLFLDHVAMALATHLFAVYAEPGFIQTPRRADGLTPRQLRQCLDRIEDDLTSELSLETLAQACHLSTRHFTRLFVRSMGQPPYRYLMNRRVVRAKLLLKERGLSLCDVAQACGFADQSHFTRVFTAMVGVSPGAYRRTLAQ